MPDGLYDQDVLLWAERQADLLRRLQAGERVNEGIDWANLIEEVESVGRSELRSCGSLLFRTMEHLLKLALLPQSRDVSHWRSELVGFQLDASDAYTPSMKDRIELERLYSKALRAVEEGYALDAGRLTVLRLASCPFTVADLVARDPDLDALLAHLAALIPTAPAPP